MRQIKHEQYFTKPDLARQCLNHLKKYYDLDSFEYILEPSAGSGSFYNLLNPLKRIGIDIDPKCEGLIQADFLNWNCPYDNVLTIGNPPFGRRAQIATKFINHSSQFSKVIAFILPRTFKRETFYFRINKHFHLVDQFDCDDFITSDGKELKIKCVFQIWEKRENLREDPERKTSHSDFILKHAHMSKITQEEFLEIKNTYDFAIPQVGNSFKPKEIETITTGSNWFIKVLNEKDKSIFYNLDFNFLENTNLSFTRVSRKDIIQAYETEKNKQTNNKIICQST